MSNVIFSKRAATLFNNKAFSALVAKGIIENKSILKGEVVKIPGLKDYIRMVPIVDDDHEIRFINQAGCSNPNCKVCYPFGKNTIYKPLTP